MTGSGGDSEVSTRSVDESAETDEEWRFSLEDIERREAEQAADAETDDAEAAAPPEPEPLEPGSPTIEGVVFFLLGAAVAIFIFSRLFV
ncbi:MAG: hypothetical protein PPP58_06480 [Natronomonas sp.]